MSRRPTSRRRTIAIGSLALVLLGAPFLPDGDTPPALETSSTPGCRSPTPPRARAPSRRPCARRSTRSSPRVVRRRAPRAGARLRPAALVRSQVRCADFEGQRYCLNAGWTDSTEDEVVTELAQQRDLRERATGVPRGDRRPVADRPAPPARRARPGRPREGRPRRAHGGRPVGGQGVAAAPPGPGRRPAGRVPGPAPGDPHPDRVGHHHRAASTTTPTPRGSRSPTTRHAPGSSATTRSPSRPAPTGAARRRCR